MRNLKKVLALVLALVMALSLVTIANAADFSDSADIDYGEAVDVMSAIGVIEGMGNNSFDPDGTLTREQAAKLITYMLLGENADKLGTEGSSFKDVAATRWSAPAIEYCVSMGIIDGAGDGNFYPAGKLTGYAFAKMLLTAIGYDSQIEKYVGSSWTINVASRAIDVGLQKGLDKMFGSAEISRQEAAQMAFNAVKTPLVEYADKGSTITVGGTEIDFGATKATYVVVERTDGSTSSDNIDTAETANGADLIEFGERYYPDLIKDPDSNRLEQPAHKWTYKDKDIGTYADDEDKMVVVDAKDKTLEDIIYGKSYMNYSTSKVDEDNLKNGANSFIFVNGDAVAWDTDEETTLGSVALNKGDTVYTYTNSKGEIETIVVARYMLAKIDEVSEKVSTSEKENGAAYRVKLVDLDGNAINSVYYDDHNTANRVLTGFSASDYTEGTILAVAFDSANAGNRIQDSYVVDTVTGKPTAAKEAGDGHITVDGKKYQFVTNNLSSPSNILIDGVYQNFDFDSEYNVYLTKGGYVLGIEGAEALKIDDIYYVTGIYSDEVGGETRYYAQRVALIDGKVDTVQIEKGSLQVLVDHATIVDGESGTDVTDKLDSSEGTAFAGLYTFNDKKYDAATLDTGTSVKQNSGNDILSLIPFSKDAIDTAKTIYGSAYAEEDFAVNGDTGLLTDGGTLSAKLEKADTKMKVGGTNYYMNADTQYVAVESLGSDIDVTVATGGMNVNDTDKNALVVVDKNDTKTALAFVIAGDSLTVSAASKEVVYLPSDTNTRYGNDNYTNDLWFMADGNLIEDAVITTDEDQGFYTYSESDGVYKLTSGATNILSLVASGNYTYDDESGYGMGLTITGAYSKSNVNYVEIAPKTSGNTLTFGAVKLNGVTITDLRSSGDMEDDVYKIEISSVSDLKNAANEGTVTADVYFNEGVTFIAITDVEDEGAGGQSFAADAEEVNTVKKVQDLLDAGTDVTITGTGWAPTNSEGLTSLDIDTASLSIPGDGLDLSALNLDINVDNDETLTVAGAIATGTGDIAVDGTLTGATTITTSGTVAVDGALDASGALTSGNITLTTGTMDVDSIDTSAQDGTITVTAGTLTVAGAIATGSGNITVNDTLTGATTITTTGTVTVDGALDASGKITSGVLTLTDGTLDAGEIDTSAANSNIVVTAGTLTSTGAVNAGSGDITVAGTLTATDQAVTAGTFAVTTGTATVGDVAATVEVTTGTLTAAAVTGTLEMKGAGRATVDSVGDNDLADGDITSFAGATITIVDDVTADSADVTSIAKGTWNFTGMFTTDGTNATTVAAATTANFNGGITFGAEDTLKAADAVTAVMTVGNVTSTTNASETLICDTDGSTPLTSADIKGLTFKGTADTNNKWAKQAS